MKKKIKIDHSKCTACRHCEVVCSLKHFQNVNTQKSCIRVFLDEDVNLYFPVIAGPSTQAECTSKYDVVIVGGQQYDNCALCGASCPSKTWFREPDTENSLKCDFCCDPPDPECVKVCASGALFTVET
jgi:Fe-S-cluster-containing hydrogenase component 2